MSKTVAECVVCGAAPATRVDDPVPAPSTPQSDRLPHPMPPVELCEEHLAAYRTDWVLLGWCVDHYAEALRFCPAHQRVVNPL